MERPPEGNIRSLEQTRGGRRGQFSIRVGRILQFFALLERYLTLPPRTALYLFLDAENSYLLYKNRIDRRPANLLTSTLVLKSIKHRKRSSHKTRTIPHNPFIMSEWFSGFPLSIGIGDKWLYSKRDGHKAAIKPQKSNSTETTHGRGSTKTFVIGHASECLVLQDKPIHSTRFCLEVQDVYAQFSE